MDDSYSYMSIMLFVGFVILDAVVYGFGAAVQSLNIPALDREAESGNKKARKLQSMIEAPGKLIHVNQIVTNLVGMITGAAVLFRIREAAGMLLDELVPAQWLFEISLVAVTVALLLMLIAFGMIIPKRLAVHQPEKWAYRLLPVISVISMILAPFGWLVTRLSSLALKIVGIDNLAEDDNVTEEEIMSMVNEGHEQGVLEASEAEMITNIVQLDNKEAGDIMTHRKNIVALDGSMSLKEAVDFILTEGKNSRYPVYDEEIDNVIGILHMKDAVICEKQGNHQECALKDIPGLLREACFIPETRNISDLFRSMQSRKIHMVVVVDEYGQMAGIVTMEDILEEIVGNIMDEYDTDEEYIHSITENSFLMDGMTPLDEVTDTLHIEFEEEDYDAYDTINGLLVSKLGKIPEKSDVGKQIHYSHYIFQIQSVENKTINTVEVFREI